MPGPSSFVASPEQLSLSYNGGKDCLVLLVLVLACLPAWASSSSAPSETASEQASTDSADSRSPSPHTFPDSFQAIYIISQDPFPEVESFVAQSAAYYHLDLARYALPMRAALEAYLKRNKRIKAMFVGTRRTDPHGEYLTHFDPTDKDWPQFMRIHPVIDWHYAEIWAVRDISLDIANRDFPDSTGETVHSAPWNPILRAL